MTWWSDLLAFLLGNQRVPDEKPSSSPLSQMLWADAGWTAFIRWAGNGAISTLVRVRPSLQRL